MHCTPSAFEIGFITLRSDAGSISLSRGKAFGSSPISRSSASIVLGEIGRIRDAGGLEAVVPPALDEPDEVAEGVGGADGVTAGDTCGPIPCPPAPGPQPAASEMSRAPKSRDDETRGGIHE